MGASDITITPANVQGAAGLTSSGVSFVTFGETVTAGQLVYEDTSDNNHCKLANNSASATAVVKGVAITGGGDGDPGYVVTSGPVEIGGTTNPGEGYCLSDVNGAIGIHTDLAAADYVSQIGVGMSGNRIYINITNTGETHG